METINFDMSEDMDRDDRLIVSELCHSEQKNNINAIEDSPFEPEYLSSDLFQFNLIDDKPFEESAQNISIFGNTPSDMHSNIHSGILADYKEVENLFGDYNFQPINSLDEQDRREGK